jgi:hypothetical protein
MPDDEKTDVDRPDAEEAGAAGAASGPTPAGRVPDVPPEQRGAADDDATPRPEPGGDRSGGVGTAAGAGGVLESSGGPSTVDQQDEQDVTLAEELVQEAEESVGEVSPDMGTTEPDPRAGGVRFEELVEKRKKAGLSDEEAEELGELMAHRDGREWTSTQQLKAHPVDST